jgi:hypothetical protein
MHARESAFAARHAGAAIAARNIAAMLEGAFRDKPPRLGAARVLLARRTSAAARSRMC